MRYTSSRPRAALVGGCLLLALSVFERAYGLDHQEVAATLPNLAAVLAKRDETTSLRRRQPDVALTRNNIGKLISEMGRPVEAVSLLAAAAAVLEERLTSEHPTLMVARENLGRAILLAG